MYEKTHRGRWIVFKKTIILGFLVLSLSACAGTGTWVPNDPTTGSQDKSNRDMQQCIEYGDQTLNSASALPGLSMAIRNSRVEDCMKRLGYHKAGEQTSPEAPTTSK